jgi:hypothetical protein
MLVILMENQLLQPEMICKSCPMASQSGLPRWQEGRLRCGRPVIQPTHQGPAQFECAMGFRVAELSDPSGSACQIQIE